MHHRFMLRRPLQPEFVVPQNPGNYNLCLVDGKKASRAGLGSVTKDEMVGSRSDCLELLLVSWLSPHVVVPVPMSIIMFKDTHR